MSHCKKDLEDGFHICVKYKINYNKMNIKTNVVNQGMMWLNEVNPKNLPITKLIKGLELYGEDFDMQSIFSTDNARNARYYHKNSHPIENTYICFFDTDDNSIKTSWNIKNEIVEKTFFKGNSIFEISHSVLIGFGHVIDDIMSSLSSEEIDKYYIACPTYRFSNDTMSQYVDLQGTVTGKLLCDMTGEECCKLELSEELGIMTTEPLNDPITARGQMYRTRNAIVHNYSVNINKCEPYDGKGQFISNTSVRDTRVQIVTYGTFEDFENVFKNVKRRASSHDMKDLSAIRLVPIKEMKVLFCEHF